MIVVVIVRRILGTCFIIAGIAGALYLGVWLCFVGGIADIATGMRATPVDGLKIVVGLLKTFILTGIVIKLVFWFCTIVGVSLLGWEHRPKWFRLRKG